jgi:uncharacterized protein (TIGR02118 family)
MIRLSVFYPSTEGAAFDHDYYRDTHVPLAVKTWGLDGAEIDKGVDGPYVAAVHFTFDSLDALGAAMSNPGTAERDGRHPQLHDDRARAADQREGRLIRATPRARQSATAPSPALITARMSAP